MRIAINGTGIAGPTLAWWLKKYGFEPVLFEQAPELRTGGYMIDFWGIDYEIAEKMGVMPELQKKGYLMEALHMVDKQGGRIASMNTENMRTLMDGRLLSIARSDLAATIFHACEGVETRFGTHIIGVEDQRDGVIVELSNGNTEKFDLVIGADGLHSQIRSLIFGKHEGCEYPVGAYVAAFTLPRYHPRHELNYVAHAATKRQVARVSQRDDKTLFLFTFRSEFMEQKPKNEEEKKALLRSVFADMDWEVPAILARLDEAEDFYYDSVSQIRLDHWSKGRIALLGDAAACVSLLAGEGTGLAIVEAYVLAGELHRANGDHVVAFRKYEEILHAELVRKQKSALRMLAFFAPNSRFQAFLIRKIIRVSSIPLFTKRFIEYSLKDNFEIPNYNYTESIK